MDTRARGASSIDFPFGEYSIIEAKAHTAAAGVAQVGHPDNNLMESPGYWKVTYAFALLV